VRSPRSRLTSPQSIRTHRSTSQASSYRSQSQTLAAKTDSRGFTPETEPTSYKQWLETPKTKARKTRSDVKTDVHSHHEARANSAVVSNIIVTEVVEKPDRRSSEELVKESSGSISLTVPSSVHQIESPRRQDKGAKTLSTNVQDYIQQILEHQQHDLEQEVLSNTNLIQPDYGLKSTKELDEDSKEDAGSNINSLSSDKPSDNSYTAENNLLESVSPVILVSSTIKSPTKSTSSSGGSDATSALVEGRSSDISQRVIQTQQPVGSEVMDVLSQQQKETDKSRHDHTKVQFNERVIPSFIDMLISFAASNIAVEMATKNPGSINTGIKLMNEEIPRDMAAVETKEDSLERVALPEKRLQDSSPETADQATADNSENRENSQNSFEDQIASNFVSRVIQEAVYNAAAEFPHSSLTIVGPQQNFRKENLEDLNLRQVNVDNSYSS